MAHPANPSPAFLLISVLALSAAPGSADQSEGWLISNVRIVDVTAGNVGQPSDVLIRDGKIASIHAHASYQDSSPTKRIDAAGRFAIPGLWDMHTHIQSPEEYAAMVPLLAAHGVIGIRDLWGLFPDEFQEQGQGLAYAPIVYAAARQMTGNSAGTPELALESMRRLAERGVDFIKVQSNIPRESFYAIKTEARRMGLSVVGHTPLGMAVSETAEAGLATQEHLLEALIEISADAEFLLARRTRLLTAGGLSSGEYILELGYPDLDPILATRDLTREQRLFDTLRRHHTWQVPTLVLFRAWSRAHHPDYLDNPVMAYVPAAWRERWTPAAHKWYSQFPDDGSVDVPLRIRAMYEARMDLLRRMHAAGVPIMAGTDVSTWNFIVAGTSLHDELAIFVEAGMTPREALYSATHAPVEFFGIAGETGALEAGKAANLVLLNGNPLEDIENVRAIEAVVRDGQYLDRAYLDALLEAARRAAN